MKHKRFFISLGLLFALALLLLGVFFVRTLLKKDEVISAPVASPSLHARTQSMNHTTLDLALNKNQTSFSCTQTTQYKNTTGRTLDRVQFRLSPNVFKRADTSPQTADILSFGEVFITDVRVDHRPAAWAIASADETVLDIPLTLENGAECTLTLQYTLSLPEGSGTLGIDDGTLLLCDAFAVPAVHEEGFFRKDTPYAFGNSTYTESQNFTLHLTLPEGWTAAVSGALRSDDGNTLTYESLGARTLSLALSKDFYTAQTLHGDTLLQVYARSRAAAKKTLSAAKDALCAYESLFQTPYPYPTLTLVQGNLSEQEEAGYSAFALIGDAAYQKNDDAFAQIVARAVARQAFGTLVGTDAFTTPWLNESLSYYAAMLFIKETRGDAAFEALYAANVEPALRLMRPLGLTTGASVDAFLSAAEYEQTVSQRGAGMLHGIHEAIGTARFCDFLAMYLDRYAFSFATRDGFAQTLQESTGANWNGYLDDYLDG